MPSERAHASRSARAGLLAALGALALAGCGLLDAAAEAPGKLASALTPGEEAAAQVDPDALAPRLMRFADLFEFEIDRSTREFAERGGTPEARIQALDWYVDYTSAVFRRAAVAQPYAGLFDVVLLVTAMRDAHEHRWTETYGELDAPMLAGIQRIEDAAWALVGESMTAPQIEETRKLLGEWLAADPEQRVADAARLPGLGERIGSQEAEGGFVSGLTDLVRIDPLSGLDPTVREVKQARQLLERMFFFAQRFPKIAEARVQLSLLRAAQNEDARVALEGWERVSKSAEALSETIATLPAELTRQREGLVQDLAAAQAPVSGILEETRSAAESTRALSDSLQLTLAALGTFLDRFEKEEPARGDSPDGVAPGAPGPEPEGPPRKPFDVAEYGIAAERIGAAVRELDATLLTLDQKLPALQRALDEAAARGERTVDHAYRRALQLLAAALLGGALVVVAVRLLTRGRRSAPSAPEVVRLSKP